MDELPVEDAGFRRTQSRTLEAVVDSLDVAVIGCDQGGRPVLTNEASRTLLGAALTDHPPERWPERLALQHPDGRPARTEELPPVRALHGETVHDLDLVLRRSGRPRRILRVNARPVPGETGSALAAVTAMHDVTSDYRATVMRKCELKVAELTAQPQPAEEVLAEVTQIVGAMVGWAATELWSVDGVAHGLRRVAWWADPEQRPEPVNPLPEILRPDQGLPGRAWQTTDPIWDTDLREESDPLDWGPLRAALAVPIPSGAAIVGVLVCYSDTEEIPDDLRTAFVVGISAHLGEFLERRRAERLTAELDRTRDEYIALVGHDVRTPLTSIQSYTDLLLDDPALTGDQHAMLTVMQRNATELHGLVGRLLDVAGLRSGHLKCSAQRVDLTPIVQAAVDEARANRPTSAVTVEVNTPERAVIDGDPQRLRQALDELLSNATTWAPDGSAVTLTVHADAHTMALTVSNTGDRISADEHARLFESFFRTDATRLRGVPGTGLGLTLVQAIADQHHGTLTVSEPDEPVTSFTLRLPTHQPEPPDRAG